MACSRRRFAPAHLSPDLRVRGAFGDEPQEREIRRGG